MTFEFDNLTWTLFIVAYLLMWLVLLNDIFDPPKPKEK